MKIIKYIFLITLMFSLITCSDESVNVEIGKQSDELTDKFPGNHEAGWIRVKFTELDDDLNTSTRSGKINTGIAQLDEVANMLGATIVERVFNEGGRFKERRKKYGLHLWYDFYVGENQSVTRSVRSFSDLPMIDIVELIPVDYQTSFNDSPFTDFSQAYINSFNAATRSSAGDGHKFNDPLLNLQWHYYNDGSTPSSIAGADANIFTAWQVTTGHPDVIVAIVDGGIDVNHPDLKQNLWINKGEIAGNDLDDDDNGYTDDIYGWKWGRSSIGAVASGDIFPMDHGSHCAGTVAAVNNNGVGLAGVAGGNGSSSTGVRLMSCQTYVPDFENYPNDPHGNSRSTSQTPDAFAYAADNGAVIANCSFSYSGTTLSAAYKAGIDYFVDNAGMDENGVQTGPMKGGLMVASAGNDGTKDLTKYPASYEKVINVAYSMSNYKKSPSSNYGFMVDVTAPGGATSSSYAPGRAGGVFSTIAMESINWNVEKGYMYKSGTSMAAPHVAGIAALILSAAVENNIPMTWQKLREVIFRSCWSLDEYNPEYAGQLGHGQVDAGTAIQILLAGDDYKTDQPEEVSLEPDIYSITLKWKVPADFFDNPINSVEIFYSMSELEGADLDNLPSGVKRDVVANKKAIGEFDSRTISNLSPDSQFYFALRSVDKQGQKSDPVYISGKTKSAGNNGDGGDTDPVKPDVSTTGQFKVFPTTVKELFYIASPTGSSGKVVANIFSSTGYKVLTKEFTASQNAESVGVKSLTTGVYTVQIEHDGKKETHNIIKY